MSEFNEDNEVSQAHFALQQLSNTFLTREKGEIGDAGEEPPRPGSRPRGQRPASPGAGAGARRPGLTQDVGLTPVCPGRGGSAPLHRPGSAPSSPAQAPRRGSIKKSGSADRAWGGPRGAWRSSEAAETEVGPSPWLAARRFPGAGSLPGHRLRAFWAGDPQFFSPPRSSRCSRASLPKEGNRVRWMLGSSPTLPGQFLPVPGTPGTAAASPSRASRSADTVSDPRGEKTGRSRCRAAAGTRGRGDAGPGPVELQLPKFWIYTIKSKPGAFPMCRFQAMSFTAF